MNGKFVLIDGELVQLHGRPAGKRDEPIRPSGDVSPGADAVAKWAGTGDPDWLASLVVHVAAEPDDPAWGDEHRDRVHEARRRVLARVQELRGSD